jgi:hypothetical protein
MYTSTASFTLIPLLGSGAFAYQCTGSVLPVGGSVVLPTNQGYCCGSTGPLVLNDCTNAGRMGIVPSQ